MEHLKFPIGPFQLKENYTEEEFQKCVEIIRTSPATYRSLVQDLSEAEMCKTYREGSWTIRQLVHHVADIQLLHYFRMKKAITEPDYAEATLIDMGGWAHTADSVSAPLEDSLLLFEGVHQRYAYLIESLTPEQLELSYFHPVRNIYFNQKQAIAISAWHVQHHLAHIELALGMRV
ncbi:hypothetical protein BWI93_25805 [Siphonobacter sp. BAB-5385]|uniref:YfiT family bacillithiol transferase n=1 Tax=Siphonobacter sp. BAB-5385 TaxID=1864822 RepID=UPI000B9E1D44|nr:putative metal-dependent hydrolase [Siphonobacter sp. BAB-5385]OZI05390.1 hypothetical protein BWI93_25805 [Siphonobacter sp. BAB-5385]